MKLKTFLKDIIDVTRLEVMNFPSGNIYQRIEINKSCIYVNCFGDIKLNFNLKPNTRFMKRKDL